MVDHPRLALRPRRLAVHPGIGGTAGRAAEREVAADFSTHAAVVPRLDRGTQYAAASRSITTVSGILDRPVKAGR
ncbi:hypothetical protein XH93_22865 [Bradyrhizobium sp. CCBAU 51753]|nr:hypothetical protein XH93_22865 [Bradyrhizobium sp. CCBAU 51753]